MFTLQRVASVVGRTVYRTTAASFSTSAAAPVVSSRLVVGTITTDGQTNGKADGADNKAASTAQQRSKSGFGQQTNLREIAYYVFCFCKQILWLRLHSIR